MNHGQFYKEIFFSTQSLSTFGPFDDDVLKQK